MALAPINLTMFRGDTPSFNLVITTDGAARNISTDSLRMTAKYSTYDADNAAVFSKTIGSGITIVSGAGGTATVLLSKTDTNTLPGQIVTLFYDIQLSPSGNVPVFTIAWGTLTILPDVSITVP